MTDDVGVAPDAAAAPPVRIQQMVMGRYRLDGLMEAMLVVASGLGFETNSYIDITVLDRNLFTGKKLFPSKDPITPLDTLDIERVESFTVGAHDPELRDERVLGLPGLVVDRAQGELRERGRGYVHDRVRVLVTEEVDVIVVGLRDACAGGDCQEQDRAEF